MSDEKLCINCKHHVVESVMVVLDEYKCNHPARYKDVKCLVTGQTYKELDSISYYSCERNRMQGKFCGPEGKHFEQKEPNLGLIDRLMKILKS